VKICRFLVEKILEHILGIIFLKCFITCIAYAVRKERPLELSCYDLILKEGNEKPNHQYTHTDNHQKKKDNGKL